MRETTIAISSGKCLRPTCRKDAVRRGLCISEYVQVMDVISAGEITEEEAVLAGLILPKRRTTREWIQGAVQAVRIAQ